MYLQPLPDFFREAECSKQVAAGTADPDWWHPPSKARFRWVKAEEVCNMCPIKMECRSWAAINNHARAYWARVSGVWGGKFFAPTSVWRDQDSESQVG